MTISIYLLTRYDASRRVQPRRCDASGHCGL